MSRSHSSGPSSSSASSTSAQPSTSGTSRTQLRLVNIVLTLCWALMMARLYQKWASSGLTPRIFTGQPGYGTRSMGASPPDGGGSSSSSSSSGSSGGLVFGVGAGGELSGGPFSPFVVKKPGSKALVPSGASAGPPSVMSFLAGRCFYFVIPDRSIKLEWCPEDHVTHVHMPKFASFDVGWYKGWKTEVGADGKVKYLHQEYLEGDKCGNDFNFPRTTQVFLRCKPDAQGTLYSEMSRGVDLIEFKEVDLCKYTMTLGLKEWCEVEPEVTPPPPTK